MDQETRAWLKELIDSQTVLIEQVRDDVRAVADGLLATASRLERKMDDGFAQVGGRLGMLDMAVKANSADLRDLKVAVEGLQEKAGA